MNNTASRLARMIEDLRDTEARIQPKEVTNMAKTKNQAKVEEPKEETNIVTPTALAADLEISPKALRAFLRREFPRTDDQKNTSWRLSQDQIDKATTHFTTSDEDEVEAEA